MTTLFAIVGSGLVLIWIGLLVFAIGDLRGFRAGLDQNGPQLDEASRQAARYQRLWLHHREKGARLRRRIWEIRRAIDGKIPGERSDP